MRPGTRRWLAPTLAAIVAALVCSTASASERWLYVKIDSPDPEAGLELSLPFGLVRGLIASVDREPLRGGKIHLGDTEVNGVELRAILRSLAALDDGEFLRIREHDGSARVAREGHYLVAEVDDASERVRVRVPMAVVAALASGAAADGTLDVTAALDALATHRGDLVQVDDGGESVRVWIAEPDGEN